MPIDYNALPASARLRIKHVVPLVGLSRTTIWRYAQQKKFPQPKRSGAVTTWRYGDVLKWLEGKQ